MADKNNQSDTHKLTLRVPTELWKEVKQYKDDNYMVSDSDAVRSLIAKGLQRVKNEG